MNQYTNRRRPTRWWCCVQQTPQTAREVSLRRNKLIILLSVLFVVLCVFIIIGVSNIIQIGSVSFFVFIVSGSLIFLWFFFALISLARVRGGRLSMGSSHNMTNQTSATQTNIDSSGGLNSPVFYFLQPIRRSDELAIVDPVDDGEFWAKGGDMGGDSKSLDLRGATTEEPCPICLCEMDLAGNLTGISNCCKRPIHLRCARKYFNVLRRVQCPLCRHAIVSPNTSTQAATPEPV